MFRRPIHLVLALACALAGLAAHAGGTVLQLPTRPGVQTPVFWEAAPAAIGTVLVFPGGEGGFGALEDGRPKGVNFLVRSTPYFLAHGFNVAIFGRPNGIALTGTERSQASHLLDMQAVVEQLKQQSGLPIWIVGTSLGTVSAAALAIHLKDPAIAGLVLTSSVVKAGFPGALPGQDLEAIEVPVLLYHHARDGCPSCAPAEMPALLPRLTHAPVRKLMLVDGGYNPAGDVCGPRHWHGFIGMEQKAVDTITGWMEKPVP